MTIEGFTYDARQDLYIADGSADIDWTDGSEGYLRRVLEKAEHITDYPVELAGSIHDWPSRYHLSHLRVNFFEAIRPLLQSSWRALEIGGGTGVLTKWLAQVVAEVDTLEGSPERARVNRIRTRDDRNVRVLVGDMVAAPFAAGYDLATLIGVLEYTPSRPGVTRPQACLELLLKVRGSLSEDGVLAIAIENRLGAKYWAGCGEDHSSKLFDGVLGYPDDTPVTFSRGELEALLREAGFDHMQFYHLHPDYKLCTTVIRETAAKKEVALHQWTMSFAEDYTGARKYLLPDPLLMKSVEDAGLFAQFANSFLVLCSTSPKAALAGDWLAKKFANSTRPELHHTITLVERGDTLRVERSPIRHGRSQVDLGDYRFALSDGDHVNGSLLAVEAYKALASQQWHERLAALCGEVLQAARLRFGLSAPAEGETFDRLDGAALDFTFWNLMRRPDGSLHLFDTKWTCARPIDADYLLFRGLLHFLSAGAHFLKADLRQTITTLLQQHYPAFDEERFAQHLEAERHLQECVHARDLSRVFQNVQSDWTDLSRMLPPPPSKPFSTAARVWRTKGTGAFIRLLLFKLRLIRDPGLGS